MLGGIHLHVGSGRLGLGLIVAVGCDAGLSPVLLTRPDEVTGKTTREVHRVLSVTKALRLRHLSPDGEDEIVEYPLDLHPMADIDALLWTISAETPVLVTISVGTDSIEGSTLSCLRRIAELRTGSETIYVTCENRVSPTYKQALQQIRTDYGTVILDSVVDRICTDRQISRSGTAVEVDAERYHLWLIESPASTNTTSVMERLLGPCIDGGYVELVPNLAAYKQRKAMIVNGPHIALALKTALQRTPTATVRTDQLLAANDGVAQMVEALHYAASRALVEDFPNVFEMDEVLSFAESVRDRFLAFPDSAERILSKLYRGDYLEFVLGFHARLLLPMERGVDPDLVEEIAADLTRVMERRGLLSRFFTDIAKKATDLGYDF